MERRFGFANGKQIRMTEIGFFARSLYIIKQRAYTTPA